MVICAVISHISPCGRGCRLLLILVEAIDRETSGNFQLTSLVSSRNIFRLLPTGHFSKNKTTLINSFDIDSLVRVNKIPGGPSRVFRGPLSLLKLHAKLCTFFQGNGPRLHSLFFSFLMATLAIYGSSQARGPIRAAAASLSHSHGCDLHCSLRQHQILNPLRPGIEPTSSLILCEVLKLLSHSENSFCF